MVALAWRSSEVFSLAVVEGDERWMSLEKGNGIVKRPLRDDHPSVTVTAPWKNKVRRVGYPHVSRPLATASATAGTIPHGSKRG